MRRPVPSSPVGVQPDASAEVDDDSLEVDADDVAATTDFLLDDGASAVDTLIAAQEMDAPLTYDMFVPLSERAPMVDQTSQVISHFLLLNNIDSRLVSRLAGDVILVGGEKDGKTTTASNVLEKPVGYMNVSTATRSFVLYCHELLEDDAAQETTARIVDQTGAVARETTAPLKQLPREVERIMKSIESQGNDAVSDKVVVVTMGTNRPGFVALRFLDAPGTVGTVANATFAEAVTRMLSMKIKQSVLPAESKSHCFLFSKLDANTRTSSWLRVFDTKRIDNSKVHVVFTHAKNYFSAQNLQRELRNHNVSNDDDGLLQLLRLRIHDLCGPSVSIHIIDNADATVSDNHSYEEAVDEIKRDENNKELMRVLASLPGSIPGYVRKASSYEQLRQMIGVEPLRRIAHGCACNGIVSQLGAVKKLLQKRADVILERGSVLHNQKKACNKAPVADTLLRNVWILLGHALNGDFHENPDDPLMPTKKSWHKISAKYARHLRQELRPTFPRNLTKEQLEHLYHVFQPDADEDAVCALLVRLNRVIPFAVTLMLLQNAKKLSKKDISRQLASYLHKQANQLDTLLAQVVSDVVKARMTDMSEYLLGATRNILQEGVDFVKDLLRSVPMDSYFPGSEAQCCKEKLLDDIGVYLGEKFVKPSLDAMRRILEEAQEPLRSVVTPYAPDLLEKIATMMPKFASSKDRVHRVLDSLVRKATTRSVPQSVKIVEAAAKTMSKPLVEDDDEGDGGSSNNGEDCDGATVSDEECDIERVVPLIHIITQQESKNVAPQPTSVAQLSQTDCKRFNSALTRQVISSLLMTTLQIPMTFIRPVIDEIRRNAHSLDVGSFCTLVAKDHRQTALEKEIFGFDMGDAAEDAEDSGDAPPAASEPSLASLLLKEYSFEAPIAALDRQLAQHKRELLEVKRALSLVESYRLSLGE